MWLKRIRFRYGRGPPKFDEITVSMRFRKDGKTREDVSEVLRRKTFKKLDGERKDYAPEIPAGCRRSSVVN
jgi:hypothetical protein